MLSAKAYLNLEQTLFKFAHVVSDPECEWCQGTGVVYEHDYGPGDELIEWQDICGCVWEHIWLRPCHPDHHRLQFPWLYDDLVEDEVPF